MFLAAFEALPLSARNATPARSFRVL
jgi:hypothetical protein